MKVSQTKLHWVAIHVQCFSSHLLILVFLPVLSFQRCWWRNLQPMCCRQRWGLHRERCDPAGQADPDWGGLLASEQCGAPGSESKYNERLYDNIGQSIPSSVRLREMRCLLYNQNSFNVSWPCSHKESVIEGTWVNYYVFFNGPWSNKAVITEIFFFFTSATPKLTKYLVAGYTFYDSFKSE